MSSPKSYRSHRHSGGASPTTSPRSRSSSSSSSKRKSEVFCAICLKETVPIFSRSTLFSIHNYCSIGCYSKSTNEFNETNISTTTSNTANSSLETSTDGLSTRVSSESSFRKFSYNSNNNNFIQVE